MNTVENLEKPGERPVLLPTLDSALRVAFDQRMQVLLDQADHIILAEKPKTEPGQRRSHLVRRLPATRETGS